MPFLFGRRTKPRHNPTSKDNLTFTSSQLKLQKSLSITTRSAGGRGTHETESIFRRKTFAGPGTVTSRTSDALLPPPPSYSKVPSGFEEMEKEKMPLDPYRFTELLLQAARDRDSASLTDSGRFPFADDVDSGTRTSELLIKAPPPTPRNHRSLSRPSSRHHHQQVLSGVGLGKINGSPHVPRALRASHPVNGVSTVQFPCVESNRGVDDSQGGYRSLVGVSIAIMEGRRSV